MCFFHFGYSDLFSPCNHVIIVLCAVVQESGGLLHTGGGDPGHGEAGPSSTPGFHNLIVSRMLYDLYALYIYITNLLESMGFFIVYDFGARNNNATRGC